MIKAKHLLRTQKNFIPITLLCVFLNQNYYAMEFKPGPAADVVITDQFEELNPRNSYIDEIFRSQFLNFFKQGKLDECRQLLNQRKECVDGARCLCDLPLLEQSDLTLGQASILRLLIEAGGQPHTYGCLRNVASCRLAAILKAHKVQLENVDVTQLNSSPWFVWSLEETENGKRLTQYSKSPVSMTPVQTMEGSFSHIAVAPQGSLWRVDSNGDIYFKLPYTLSGHLQVGWMPLRKKENSVLDTRNIKQLVIDSDNNLWCLDDEGGLWTRPGFTEGNWERIIVLNKKLRHIALNSYLDQNEIWAVDDQGKLSRAGFAKGELPAFWDTIDSKHQFDQIVVGLFGAVCARTHTNTLVWRTGISLQKPIGTDWEPCEDLGSLQVKIISATPQGEFWAHSTNGVLLRRVGVTPENPIGTGWYKVISDSKALREEPLITSESSTSQSSTSTTQTPVHTPEVRRVRGNDSPTLFTFSELGSLFSKVRSAGSSILKRKTNTTSCDFVDVTTDVSSSLSSLSDPVSSSNIIALAAFNVIEPEPIAENQQDSSPRTPPVISEIGIGSSLSLTRFFISETGFLYWKDALDIGAAGTQVEYEDEPLALAYFCRGLASNDIWGVSLHGEMFHITSREEEKPFAKKVEFVKSEAETAAKVVPVQLLVLGKQLFALGSDGKIYVRVRADEKNPGGLFWTLFVENLGYRATNINKEQSDDGDVLLITAEDGSVNRYR